MINWKVRFKNPIFIANLVMSILLPILTYFGLTVEDLTTWSKLGNVLVEALCNPYVVGTIIVSVWNAVNDPTTKGVSDSNQALTYESPKE